MRDVQACKLDRDASSKSLRQLETDARVMTNKNCYKINIAVTEMKQLEWNIKKWSRAEIAKAEPNCLGRNRNSQKNTENVAYNHDFKEVKQKNKNIIITTSGI